MHYGGRTPLSLGSSLSLECLELVKQSPAGSDQRGLQDPLFLLSTEVASYDRPETLCPQLPAPILRASCSWGMVWSTQLAGPHTWLPFPATCEGHASSLQLWHDDIQKLVFTHGSQLITPSPAQATDLRISLPHCGS
jgi:hypothetical protein